MHKLTAALFTLMVCGAGLAHAQGTASATIKDAMGATVGTATLRETASGVLVKVDFSNVSPGPHALHVHTTGKCEAPMFTTAGGHFAPGGTKHGLLAAGGPHAGDLPNAYVGADGKLSLEVLVPNVTLADGPRSLMDADGSALVLHATADDYLTDPAGNAGGRIACGVIAR
jgi:Cu-Zn family superoxide dismutase